MSIAQNTNDASVHLERIAIANFSETYDDFMRGEADAEDVILSEEAVEVAQIFRLFQCNIQIIRRQDLSARLEKWPTVL